MRRAAPVARLVHVRPSRSGGFCLGQKFRKALLSTVVGSVACCFFLKKKTYLINTQGKQTRPGTDTDTGAKDMEGKAAVPTQAPREKQRTPQKLLWWLAASD